MVGEGHAMAGEGHTKNEPLGAGLWWLTGAIALVVLLFGIAGWYHLHSGADPRVAINAITQASPQAGMF
jgi:hypothetical protein